MVAMNKRTLSRDQTWSTTVKKKSSRYLRTTGERFIDKAAF